MEYVPSFWETTTFNWDNDDDMTLLGREVQASIRPLGDGFNNSPCIRRENRWQTLTHKSGVVYKLQVIDINLVTHTTAFKDMTLPRAVYFYGKWLHLSDGSVLSDRENSLMTKLFPDFRTLFTEFWNDTLYWESKRMLPKDCESILERFFEYVLLKGYAFVADSEKLDEEALLVLNLAKGVFCIKPTLLAKLKKAVMPDIKIKLPRKKAR